MSVEQKMLALTALHWRDNERLDYTDLVDGMGDPLVLDDCLSEKLTVRRGRIELIAER